MVRRYGKIDLLSTATPYLDIFGTGGDWQSKAHEAMSTTSVAYYLLQIQNCCITALKQTS